MTTTTRSTRPSYLASVPTSPEEGIKARTPQRAHVPATRQEADNDKACTRLLDTRRSIMNRSGFPNYASRVGAIAVPQLQAAGAGRPGVVGPGSRGDDGDHALDRPGVVGPGSRAEDGDHALDRPGVMGPGSRGEDAGDALAPPPGFRGVSTSEIRQRIITASVR